LWGEGKAKWEVLEKERGDVEMLNVIAVSRKLVSFKKVLDGTSP